MSCRRPLRTNGLARTFVFVLLIVPMVTLGCQKPANVYSPEEWHDLFEQAGGWKTLPFPDSKYRTGAIIKVNKEELRWIDNLDSCPYPAELLIPEPSIIPAIQLTKSRNFEAGALINFKGITAGPKFDHVSQVRMEIVEHGAPALRLVRLKSWAEVPVNAEQVRACEEELSKPDRYLVTEAFMVSKGKYTLLDRTGAAIKLETPILSQFFQFQPDVAYQVTSDGSLIIEQPVIFAIRNAMKVSSGFEILRSPSGEPQTADEELDRLYFKHAVQ